jgi:hypothetical protein
LKYLGTKYADQFALAAKDLGLPVHKEKMPPANLGSKARIVVAKHFNAWYGWNFLPPRTQLKELSVPAIKPTVSTLKILEGITYTYWVKDVGNVLAHLVDPYLKQASADSISKMYKFADVIFGVDHGQGSFRAGIKVIIHPSDVVNKEIMEEQSIAEI